MMKKLEQKLDSFSTNERKEALQQLWAKAQSGEIALPQIGREINIHCHTFFSYNSYGYSPSHFAWLARRAGLAVAGIVDFDVLDGLDEFLTACGLLGLKACAGLESRVYVPEFADKEITSPGEPGITYHMGIGFPSAKLTGGTNEFIRNLRQTAQKRNTELIQRVNRHLKPVELDYEKDVLPLTPAGNATERHICLAYARKARSIFAENARLAEYWSEKLSTAIKVEEVPESGELLNLIRAKTMKRGGVGYVRPGEGSFPRMDQTNEFILAAGGIPTLTWLDGTSSGEQSIEELLETVMSTGVAAINIIPDRNYGDGEENEKKYANLRRIVEMAKDLNLIPIVGTEMNSPGQKFVDDFSSPELAPMLDFFLTGAHIVYAHSILQRRAGLGYTSKWAANHFPDRAARNEFYEEVGKSITPGQEETLSEFDTETTPGEILKK